MLSITLLACLATQCSAKVPAPADYQGEIAVYYDAQQVAEWRSATVDGKQCLVSPSMDAGRGGELNHCRVIVDFVGDGAVELSVLHSASADLDQALAKPGNHAPFQKLAGGKETVVSHASRGEGVAWLLLAATGEVRITDVRWVAWRGTGTIFGHAAGTFQFGGTALPYRLMYPRNYDPAKSYPLVLSVSGSGGVGTDNAKSMEYVILARFLFWTYYHDSKLECFSLVTQIPPDQAIPAPYWPAGEKGQPDAYRPDWPAVNENGWYVQATLALIDSLLAEESMKVDPDRVYYTGFSYGGKGCWEFLKAGRDRFAAAICGAGWPIGSPYAVPTGKLMDRLQKEVERYKHIPVLIFVGEDDGMKLGSKAVHEVIQAQGGKSTYVEFPKTGHVPSAQKGWQERRHIEWLFEQNRRSNPPAGSDPYLGGNYGD